MSYKHPPLTVLHMADVVEDTTAIANLMGAFTFLTCYKQHARQFESWSKNNPTLTLNDGKYEGYEGELRIIADLQQAVDALIAQEGCVLYAIATYTALLPTRNAIVRRL